MKGFYTSACLRMMWCWKSWGTPTKVSVMHHWHLENTNMSAINVMGSAHTVRKHVYPAQLINWLLCMLCVYACGQLTETASGEFNYNLQYNYTGWLFSHNHLYTILSCSCWRHCDLSGSYHCYLVPILLLTLAIVLVIVCVKQRLSTG